MIKLSPAEIISLRSFLNAFFREHQPEIITDSQGTQLKYNLLPSGFELKIPLTYYSLTGRHQFGSNAQLSVSAGDKDEIVHPWCLVGLLLQDLSCRHPEAHSGHREFMQRFYNSCENMDIILTHLSCDQINNLFKDKVNFEDAENGQLSGHQLHPAPKSREGFTKDEFLRYSPEPKNHFQLHYFLADPEIVFTQSDLAYDANELVRRHFLTKSIDSPGIVIPVHPWQADYIKKLPVIKKMMKNNQLIDLGLRGNTFTATTSVRTVYSEQSLFMAKLSLNVAITNSVRMQYFKELTRGVAAHRFWHNSIGKAVRDQYPQFTPITDPAFMCLRNGETVINETAILFRCNPFTSADNNATPLATLCQDHPFERKNRFNTLIPGIAIKQHITDEQAALLWFKQYLAVAIEPLLWMYVHFGVAIEAHQQNLLIALEDDLPVKSYYRDNQGYYIIDTAFDKLISSPNNEELHEFCKGTKEFISSRFIYYLICNNVFGVINAIGSSGMIAEKTLFNALAEFIAARHADWQESNYLLPLLLESNTLPFKGNLLTRFYELDELTAPLEQQSIYLCIENLIKTSYKH